MSTPLFEDFVVQVNGTSRPTPQLAGVDCPHCHGTGKIPAATFVVLGLCIVVVVVAPWVLR